MSAMTSSARPVKKYYRDTGDDSTAAVKLCHKKTSVRGNDIRSRERHPFGDMYREFFQRQ